MTEPLPLAVVDIDGVVADVTHRLPLISRGRHDWEKFFLAAKDDPPLAVGVDLVKSWVPVCDVVFMTGRPERTRELTERWLVTHGLPIGPLFMRPDSDRRPAKSYKRTEIRRIAAGRVVGVVLDDDPSVVEVLRADGWPVQLAEWLPHSSTLASAQDKGKT